MTLMDLFAIMYGFFAFMILTPITIALWGCLFDAIRDAREDKKGGD